jgi:hypothetical protein
VSFEGDSIIELKKDSKNDGLSDYLRSIYLSKETRAIARLKYKSSNYTAFYSQYKILKNDLDVNVILNLMTKYRFLDGGINNTLWYGIKLLLHNNGIDKTDTEYQKNRALLKSIHDRDFTENGLEPMYRNNYDGPFKDGDVLIVPFMINKYLRLHKVTRITDNNTGYLKPVFSVSPKGKMPAQIQVHITPSLLINKSLVEYLISTDIQDPLYDIQQAAEKVQEIRDMFKKGNEFSEIEVILLRKKLIDFIVSFLHSFKTKWGNEITAYMMKYYMHDYFNFKRW